MGIYIIVIILVFISALFKNKKQQTIICGMILFGISAFRNSEVGIDMGSYIPLFHRISYTALRDLVNIDSEYGYVVFNKLVGTVYTNDRFLIITTSAFIIFFVSKYIYKNSKNSWLSFFLFVTLMYFGSTFNLLRQSMAMVITLNSIKFIEKRNFKRFMIYLFIAMLFHKTAICFMALYLISKFKINYKYIFSLVICVFFITLFGDVIVGVLINSIDKYNLRYNDYIISGQGFGMLILLIGVTIWGFLFGKYKSNDTDNFQIYYHMMILSICSQLIALRFSLFTRVTNYFSIAMIIFIPNVIQSIPKKGMRYFSVLYVCILTVLFYLYVLKIDVNGIVPYSFMWKK